MRIAVLSDIHGNLRALEAVLVDLRTQAVDLVVNLGDHLSGPLQAAATAELLMSQRDWVHIRGNHDRNLIEQTPDQMGLSDRAAREELSPLHLAWLQAMPATAAVVRDVLLCHGTPADDAQYLLEDVNARGVSLGSPEAIRARCAVSPAAVLCGHSHLPGFVRLDEKTTVANPGSVGLQAYYDSDHRYPHAIQNGSPHARYLLLDRYPKHWRATMRMIEYDWTSASQLAEVRGRLDWAHALATGYALQP